jgi:D-arabinonate dehydratase
MVREAIGPDTRLMIDINGTWDSTTAIQMCRKLEPYNLFWIEEPLFPDDLEGFVRLKNSTRTFIATGEQMGTRFEFRDLIQRHGVDVLQPDAARVGGITEWVKIRGMASCFGYPMAPHGMLGIHFAAAFPEVLWCEMAQLGDSYTRLGQRLLKTARQPHEPDHGYVPAFTAPGIGVELNEEVLTAAR